MAKREFRLLAVDAEAAGIMLAEAEVEAELLPETETDEFDAICCCWTEAVDDEDGSLQEAIFRRKFNFNAFKLIIFAEIHNFLLFWKLYFLCELGQHQHAYLLLLLVVVGRN